MAFYSITYDLVRNRDYEKIARGIKNISNDAWAKPTASQWIIHSEKTSEQVRDFLLNYIDHDDILFVIKVDVDNWHSYNVQKGATDWLKS